MSYFTVDPKKQAEERREDLRVALRLAESAAKAAQADPSRENRIALQAATRLAKECEAQLAEWDDEF